MTEVSVIGLGPMGTALAQTLLSNGKRSRSGTERSQRQNLSYRKVRKVLPLFLRL